jgi:hypothetical protein
MGLASFVEFRFLFCDRANAHSLLQTNTLQIYLLFIDMALL